MDGSIEALLSSDPGGLSHEQRLELLAGLDRLAGRVAARTQRVLGAVHTDPPPMLPGTPDRVRDKRFVREELACLLRLSPGVAGTRLHEAAELISRLPGTLAGLEAGRFSYSHARVLLEATGGLDAVVAGRVEARVLARAPEQTLANFRRSVERAVQRLDPRRVEDKHIAAVANRRVVACRERDGMAGLYAYLPAPDLARIMTRLHHATDHTTDATDHTTHAAGPALAAADERSADQRRADTLVHLICGSGDTGGGTGGGSGGTGGSGTGGSGSGGGAGGAGRAEVQITVSLDSLCGRSDEPGELAGHGPLPARIAAELARTWAADPTTRIRTMVIAGQQLLPPAGIDDAPTVYRPGTRLHEFIVGRDRTCRFPGCHRHGDRCEIDHIVPFDGSNTVAANLHCLCPRHHHLKHEAGWHVTRTPDGTTGWITPTGRRYDKPPDELPVDSPEQPLDVPPRRSAA